MKTSRQHSYDQGHENSFCTMLKAPTVVELLSLSVYIISNFISGKLLMGLEPTLQRLAWPGVILPASYILQRRQPSRNIAWMFPNIRTSFSWLIWRAAKGAPNCSLSSKYLFPPKEQEKKSLKLAVTFNWSLGLFQSKENQPEQNNGYATREIGVKFTQDKPMADVIYTHGDANWLPRNHDPRYCQHLQEAYIYILGLSRIISNTT